MSNITANDRRQSLIIKPRLAKCDDRNIEAKSHPVLGEPDQWFTKDFLNSRGYTGVSFDFFIDWNQKKCMDEIWIKRISLCNVCKLNEDILLSETLRLGDDISAIREFCRQIKLSAFYIIFEDDVDWKNHPKPILKVRIGPDGFKDFEYKSLNEIMDTIRSLSGGPLGIGRKGLTFGTSTLECYLAKSDAPWPGDVDLILIDKGTNQVVAILEFKKHNLKTPIGEQKLSNYYPKPDARKYDRLALLRDRIGRSVPIVVLYYPTSTVHNEIHLEVVTGPVGKLHTKRSRLLSIRGKTINDLQQELLDGIVQLVQQDVFDKAPRREN